MAGGIRLVKVPAWWDDADIFKIDSKLDAVLEGIGTRWEREGKKLGDQRNERTRQRSPLEQKVYSTMRNPRQTGGAMKKKNVAAALAMAPALMKSKVLAPIEAEWQRSKSV